MMMRVSRSSFNPIRRQCRQDFLRQWSIEVRTDPNLVLEKSRKAVATKLSLFLHWHQSRHRCAGLRNDPFATGLDP
jgi:hypothetical protein